MGWLELKTEAEEPAHKCFLPRWPAVGEEWAEVGSLWECDHDFCSKVWRLDRVDKTAKKAYKFKEVTL